MVGVPFFITSSPPPFITMFIRVLITNPHLFQVEIRPMMYLALTYDHRLIDGREAVLFLRKVKAGVEDPTSILAGV